MTGKIVRGVGGFYYVHARDGLLYECRAKGIFRKENVKPLVGDDVEISVTDPKEKTGNVDALLPRRNELVRPAAANVDQALLVFSVAHPNPNFGLLDRFLVTMGKQKIPVILCFNKTDLAGEEQIEELRGIYRGCGCRICFASAARNEGLTEIRALLDQKTTVLAGPSGVGKSTLTNSFFPEKVMQTQEISRKADRGKQTTRHTELLVLPPLGGETMSESYLLDTPGFSSLYLDGIDCEELKDYFPEFAPYASSCRFLSCMHLKEPDCAVKKAVEEGKIHRSRYESYRALCEELKEKRRY